MDEYCTITILLAASILCAAFFNGMEASFSAVSRLLFDKEEDEHNTQHVDKLLGKLYRHYSRLSSALLAGKILSIVVFTLTAVSLFPLIEEAVSSRLLAFVSLLIGISLVIWILGILLPVFLCLLSPVGTLRFFAYPLYSYYCIANPVLSFLTIGVRTLLGLFGIHIQKSDSEKAFTKVDLDSLIEQSVNQEKTGSKVNEEVKIFQNALDFSTIRIRDCMVPRTEIKGVEIKEDTQQLKTLFVETGHSKIIVYENDIDHIIGYIHSSEMFTHPDTWKEHIREIPIIPETMGAQKLLQLFIAQKKSLAVVVDEFGGTSGIVSLEDLVEEIFGDIEDEHDTNTYTAKEIGEGEYILSARLEIEKINEMFHLDLPESNDYQTLGGLILNQYQNFPKLNEEIRFHNLIFKVVKKTTTKIELVKVKVDSKEEERKE